MDWTAFDLSLRLALLTVLLLLPLGVQIGRWLAHAAIPGKGFIEALFALPLVLPPTVLGYYMLVGFGAASPLGRLWEALFGRGLVFTFEGLAVASVIANLPFAIQPVQRAFEAIPHEVREAAKVSGLSPLQAFWRIDLPLAWAGVATAAVLTFAHTLGEFGVVLMVGGAIPGETRTVSVAIYDRVQSFDNAAAAQMSFVLLAVSLLALGLTSALSARVGRRAA
ncbi:MAG: molybdate ABC transporter permease subunit [Methylobacteriaceae bacterium]|nr:molybdate ABC transporter permease subunit [Methylobacteriaceae bacterium]